MLEQEQRIADSLTDRFAFFRGKCAVTRARRIFAEAPRESMLDVIAFAKDALCFESLCTVTGLDDGDDYALIYHLANDRGIVLNIKTSAPKADPVFDTVTDYYHGATLYELEARNLLGLTIKGIPEDIRYPLPDDWPEGEYPLRKDWKQAPGPNPEGAV